jgi:glycosyltransferase involved in cell wall biosynthesis
MDIRPSSFAVCTIVASNYLARALVLHDSLKARHPEADFWLLLIDDTPLAPLSQRAVERRGIHVLLCGDLALPPSESANFRMAYDLTEISTAYKPWTMQTVIRLSGMHVFYIDPDIEFFEPMAELVSAVEEHELVLTPHVLHSMIRDGCQPAESDIMGSGIYNLGFLGMNRKAGRVIEWWQARLMRECYSAPAEQRFTDQRWIDFAPGLFDCFISKDETCNVAYWNADARQVTQHEGKYLVCGRPLSFFHYSGLDERAPHLLTRHHTGRPRVLLSEQPALATLTESYLKKVLAAQEECRDASVAYPFNEFPGGGKIALSVRRAFLQELVRTEKENEPPPPSPFGIGGERAFCDWLMEMRSPHGVGVPVPRLVLILRAVRPDLVSVFPDPAGRDAVRLVDWFIKDGIKQFSLPLRFLPAPLVTVQHSLEKNLVPGLEIIGYLRTESGMGQAGRLLARGLQSSAIPFTTMVDSSPSSRQQDPFQDRNAAMPPDGDAFDCCVLCVNADSVLPVRGRLGPGYFRKRRVAGLWFWEVETFPKHLHAAFQAVDEVWVASEFVRATLAAVSPVPVHVIPLPFGVAEPAAPLDRRMVGIPDGFFFLFSFDFHSVFNRKNPLGVVEAFKRAFREGEGPTLVIKGINGDAHIQHLERLRHAARDRRDILILSGYLDTMTNQALTAACDCYVSLHRSEGLGLTMAEAMRQGRPVIATAYSGNVDFMNDGNSYLCRYQKTPVGSGSPPYPANAQWAEPDVTHAAELMRHVFLHPAEAAEKGRIAAAELAARFNPERCAAAVEVRWHELRSLKSEAKTFSVMDDSKSSSLSAPVKSLRKESARSRDVDGAVPSAGTILFQGPRKILRKLLQRIERQRKPFDDAVVAATSDHDKRISMLERSITELRAQNAALLRAQSSSSGEAGPNGTES